MNWLIHNPIADLPGPVFLVVYVTVIVSVCVAARHALKARDGTRWDDPPPVPSKLDPYRFAYLRGGVNEVIRVVVFSLTQRGYLRIDPKATWFKKQRIRQADGHADGAGLTALESRVFRSCEAALPGELFQKGTVAAVEAECAATKEGLEAEGLLLPEEVKRAAPGTWALGAVVLMGLATYKIAVGLFKGHTNIGFLITLTFLGLIVLTIVVSQATRRKTSAKGLAYLEQLRRAFADLRDESSRRAHPGFAFETATLLMLSLYGVASLKDTGDAAFATLFSTASTSGGGCGGGCGGGGCGGGGCGGGCGGCGG